MRRRVANGNTSLFNIEPEPEMDASTGPVVLLPEYVIPSRGDVDRTSAQVSVIQKQLNELHEEIYKKGGREARQRGH
jgi:hypothetical protein